jgi:hypothetical protein
MDTAAANRLAGQLSTQGQPICHQVAARLLRAYPELTRTLRLEESYQATDRLSEVAVERLKELVRSVLLFELPALADTELQWAVGVLPRRGVTREHQTAMVRWFFEEVRRLPIGNAERDLSREVEQYLVEAIGHAFERN